MLPKKWKTLSLKRDLKHDPKTTKSLLVDGLWSWPCASSEFIEFCLKEVSQHGPKIRQC